MTSRITIADVAIRAGVHKATVSRALNKATEHQVNSATAKRVRRAARELGYVPNVIARGLRTSSTMTIGVILPDLTNPLFPPMVRGIESYLLPRGYTALIANTDGDDDHEIAAFNTLMARRVDGFIFATGTILQQLPIDAHKLGVNAVMLNRGNANGPYPLVAGDDAAGVTASVEHLVELGHRNILHISGPPIFTTSVVRSEAFMAATKRHPSVTSSQLPATSLSIEAGVAAMNELLNRDEPLPTAIVAGNDLLAVGILRAIRDHGLNCPNDISVVGFNDMPFAEDLNPPLTTVRVPNFEMGSESARILLDGFESGAQTAITVTLPTSLITRGSTAAPTTKTLRGGADG